MFLDSILCISIWYLFFSFWLTSLCIIGSGFTHLIRTDSNAFLFFVFITFVFVVQSLRCVWLFVTPCTAAHQAPLSSTISWSLLKFMSIESVMLSYHLFLHWPPSFAFSLFQHLSLFQWVGSLHRLLELQLQHQSFQWIFRVDFP